MKGERWIYLGIIVVLGMVINMQMTDVRWNREELFRTIKTANKWMDAAKTSCDGDIQGWGRNYDPHLTEY